MSHHRIKTKYENDTGMGIVEQKTLYMDINNSCDVVTIRDDDGSVIYSYGEGSNNFEDALIRLIKGMPETDDTIERWDKEDLYLHGVLKREA
mgnify:CR=1 FL=1